MAYHSDPLQAERDWNAQCGRPGKPAINRNHHHFKQGVQAFHDRKPKECTHLAGGEAWRHWHAGWDDAARADDLHEKNRDTGDRPWMIGY